jgi:MSHA biogenesis protein MshP
MLVIVVLVLLAGLSTYTVGLMTSVHSDFAAEVNHARATRAAEAGLDWARYRLVQQGALCPPASQNVALPGTLATYTVTVTCAAAGVEGGAGPTVYRLTATACNVPLGGSCPNTAAASANYVERQVSAIAER